MSAIADIRYGDMVNDPNKGVYINETSSPAGNVMVGSVRPNQINYIIPRSMNNVFDDADPDTYIFGSTDSDKAFMFDENGEIIIDSVLNLLEATNGGKIGDQKYRKVVFNKDKSSMAKLADKLAEERAKKKAKEKEKKRKEDLQREFANALYGRDVITTMASIYYLEDTVIEEVDPSKDPVFKMMTEIQAMSAELITRLKMKQIAESSNGIMIKSVEKAGNYM